MTLSPSSPGTPGDPAGPGRPTGPCTPSRPAGPIGPFSPLVRETHEMKQKNTDQCAWTDLMISYGEESIS